MKPRSGRLWKLALALLVVLGTCTNAAATPLAEAVREEISARLLDSPGPPAVWLGGSLLLTDALPEFYAARRYRPAWLDELGLNADAATLIAALRDSAAHGLCSDEFRLAFIEPLLLLEQDYLSHGILFDPHYLAVLDLLLTDAFFRYARALTGGRSEPAELSAALQANLGDDRLELLLARLAPTQPGYLALRRALADLRELSAYGGWPLLPPGPALRAGDRGARVELLKQRLYLGRDLESAQAWTEPGVGPGTLAGIRRFQERHGLKVDGVVGPLTLAEMNVSVEERIRQVEVNMMRWRRTPAEFGPRHIRVNIADYRLEVHEGGKVVMSMPVVVGTPYRKTPIFSAEMSYLEFAPYWYVPATILREDKLPLIRRDPEWVARNQYEIISWTREGTRRLDPSRIDWSRVTSRNFPGTLRMRPGPWNPLGRVKFMFPNRYAVYLHDTNERNLFARGERHFSSGCIRIERPLDLAQYLLEGLPGWDCDRIVAALLGSETEKVDLPAKIPVHLLYWTAWVDDHRQLQFRGDVYLRDAELETARAERLAAAGRRGPKEVARRDLSTSERRR